MEFCDGPAFTQAYRVLYLSRTMLLLFAHSVVGFIIETGLVIGGSFLYALVLTVSSSCFFFYSPHEGYCQPVRLLQVYFHGSRCYLFDAQCIGVLAPASLRATVRTFCALPVVLFTLRNTLYSPHKEQMRVRVWYCSI